MKNPARVLACLLLAGCASSPFARPSSRVRTQILPGSNVAHVVVATEGIPLPGIEVRFHQRHRSRVQVTPASGQVAVQLVPGNWQVVAQLAGFASARANVTLNTGEDAEIRVELIPDQFQLDASVISPPRLPEAFTFSASQLIH